MKTHYFKPLTLCHFPAQNPENKKKKKTDNSRGRICGRENCPSCVVLQSLSGSVIILILQCSASRQGPWWM